MYLVVQSTTRAIDFPKKDAYAVDAFRQSLLKPEAEAISHAPDTQNCDLLNTCAA